MFPNVFFILVDPAFSKPKNTHTSWDSTRVVVWPDFFCEHTIDIINAWIRIRRFKCGNAHFTDIPDNYFPYFEDLNRLDMADFDSRECTLFISDIRRNAIEENMIQNDMDLQALWFHQLQANNGILKFRLPYVTDEWLTNSSQHNFKRVYLKGIIQLPIWGPRSTSECRLEVQRECNTCEYDPKLHECRMAGFNRYNRQTSYYYNGQYFESFDEAATAIVKLKYLHYVKKFIHATSMFRYFGGLKNCESM
jgi:hypothetical protein